MDLIQEIQLLQEDEKGFKISFQYFTLTLNIGRKGPDVEEIQSLEEELKQYEKEESAKESVNDTF
jgi:hypothetical protein